jgi:aspartyl-tRNA(Asn)/glutamyl-tRNA(Gln) amidotransferase subunit C
MKIEHSTIEKIAHLSRLALEPHEVQTLALEAEKILDWMNQLNEIDTSNIEPLYHIHQNQNITREDIVKTEITKEQGLFNAPHKNDNYFILPKVIE